MSLDYDGIRLHWHGEWQRDGTTVVIWMKDATYQRHLNARLVAVGLPTETYLQLLEKATTYHERQAAEEQLKRRYEVHEVLRRDLAYWESRADPDVRRAIFPPPGR